MPPSPATRRLFMRSAGDATETKGPATSGSAGTMNNPKRLSLAPSFEAVDESNPIKSDHASLMIAPGLARVNSHDQSADISGDWSESTSIRSLTNERIRMSNVPSHVMSHDSHQFPQYQSHGTLNDLEEEIGDVDTILMEEDLDHGSLEKGSDRPVAGDVSDLLEKESSESALSGTRLNFGSPPLPPPSETPMGGMVGTSARKRPPESLESTLHPHTPRHLSSVAAAGAEQFHNLEMSPIVRLPEDDDDDHEMMDDGEMIPMKGPLDEEAPTTTTKSSSKGERRGGAANNNSLLQPLFREAPSPILRNKSSETAEDVLSNLHHYHHHGTTPDGPEAAGAADTSANSSGTLFSGSGTNTTSSTAGINNTTLGSNVSRPMAVRRPRGGGSGGRPMPDTSAFDVGTPSQQSLGSKDSGFDSRKAAGLGGASSSTTSARDDRGPARLLCPPTPIRTPAWAHAADPTRGHGGDSVGNSKGGGPLKRANSLIATKVLAACPPRVLDNLSSLEDSMMENDISGSTMDSTAETAAADASGEGSSSLTNGPLGRSSFAPVMEEGRGDGVGYDSPDEDDAGGEQRVGTTRGEVGPCMFRSLQEEEGTSPRTTLPNPRETTITFRQDGTDHRGESFSTRRSTWKTPRSCAESLSVEGLATFSDFDNLGILGSGAFADVYKVRSKGTDRRLYAIKRTRRQFRGVKDRERAMAEVHTMKRLQNALLSEAAAASTAGTAAQQKGQAGEGVNGGGGAHHPSNRSNYGLYLLFFIRAWQQDGFFYCQTELCSRATCRHLRLSVSSEWERDVARYPSLRLCLPEGGHDGGSRADRRLVPERAVWQICHDISRGLYHIHSYGMVHYDIKPSNIFFVLNSRWGGTICKIGDFGLAGDAGTRDDGQEGDTAYMPAELLGTGVAKHPGADIFSLGLALYELSAGPGWSLPREGDRWHELRSGAHVPELPRGRSDGLVRLIREMIRPEAGERPSAEDISEMAEVRRANALSDSFLSRYINDVERHDSRREREMESAEEEARRRSSTPIASMFNHGALSGDASSRRAATARRDVGTPTNKGENAPAFFRG